MDIRADQLHQADALDAYAGWPARPRPELGAAVVLERGPRVGVVLELRGPDHIRRLRTPGRPRLGSS
jgi:hypothetical protein